MNNFQSLQLQLHRYPVTANESLRAWNAADELLIEHWLGLNAQTYPRILVVNDDFGAIACAINKVAAKFSFDITVNWHSDSFIARQALQHNLSSQSLNITINFRSSLDTFDPADLVLYKVPKILRYQQSQIAQLNHCLTPATPIVAAGMLKSMPASVFKCFESNCSQFSTSLAKKKARLIFANTKAISMKQLTSDNNTWSSPDYPYQLSEYSNVFCQGKLDIGTRFLLQHLDTKAEHVADLGCGNGLLGLHYLALHPQSKISFYDESWMALASARANVQRNLSQLSSRCSYVQSNCLEGVSDRQFDLVLCNPPFHQQNTISEHIARQMFADSRRCLKNEGRARIVANRHLDYKSYLKPLFSNIKLVASNSKFVILDALC